jgi:hypothetical protein
VSLDESANHKHAAMAADPEHPAWEQEADAKRSIADALEPRVEFLSRRSVESIAGWVIANAPFVRSVLSSLQAGERKQLKQQRTSEFGDIEALEEECYHLALELDVKQRMLADAKRGHRDRYDPDDRGEDEDDALLSLEAAAEKAISNTPKGIAS